MALPPLPTGVNNKANPYYAKENHRRLSKAQSSKSAFDGGVQDFSGVGNELHLTYASATIGGTDAVDESPAARTITWYSDAAVTDAQAIGYDKSLDLTTNDAGISVSGIDFEDQDFTIESWWYITDYSNFNRWEIISNIGVSGEVLLICHSAGSLSNFPDLTLDTSHGDVDPTPAVELTPNTWHHVAVTREGDTVTLWLDGSEVGNFDAAGGSFSGTDLFIGIGDATPSGSQFSNMYLGPTRIDSGLARYTGPFTPPERFD